jgi:hypothetical protein
MSWQKLGQFYSPDPLKQWGYTHAANPLPEHVEGDIFRIYFNCRDERQRSFIGYLVVDVADGFKVLELAPQPVFGPGEVGCFDDSGASVGCLAMLPGLGKCLYYVGWNLSVTVPWRNSIGLAVWNQAGQVFERYSPAPIMDRHRVDPFSLSYPAVLPTAGGYAMWYGSNLAWGPTVNDMVHGIKYATSADGIHWQREGAVAIPVQLPEWYAYSRPCVLRQGEGYQMWYTYRGPAYRVGYAESANGQTWQLDNTKPALNVSASGWDSEMTAYAWVFDHAGKRYMVYNGNGYGKTGIGAAVWD